MTIRVLLPFIAATFVYSGSVLAEVLQPKTAVSVAQKKLPTIPKKPPVAQKKPPVAQKKPTADQEKIIADQKKIIADQKKLIADQKKLIADQKKPRVAPKKATVVKVVQPKWKAFTAPDGRFTVLMPGKPKRETQTQKTYMGEINLEVFAAQPPKQDVAYVVSYNDFPYNYAQMATPQEILNKAQYTALTTTKSNLVSERNIRSSNGHPGKEIEYVNAGGKITRSRMYFADGYLYQVTAITSKKQEKTLAKTITGYLNSFQIVLKK